MQDQWDDATHALFFRLAQKVWPQSGRQVDRKEALAQWVQALRRYGLDDEEIAARLGRQVDSLRRRGILSRADDLATRERTGLWVRAPRVLAADVEPRPELKEVWYDSRVAVEPAAQVRALQAELEEQTRAGPHSTNAS